MTRTTTTGPPRVGTRSTDLDRLSFGLPPLGSSRRSWREAVLARIVVLHGERAAAQARRARAAHDGLPAAGGGIGRDEAGTVADPAETAVRDEEARTHLTIAFDAVTTDRARGPIARRARMDRAFAHLDEAEAAVLEMADDVALRGRLPGLVAHVRAHLPPSHPLREQVQELAAAQPPPALDGGRRTMVVEALRVASAAGRREHVRLRSFRAIVLSTTAGLALLALGLLGLAVAQPSWIPLCFAPSGTGAVVCPTSTAALPMDPVTQDPTTATPEVAAVIAGTASWADAPVVMAMGLVAAAVTSAAALRRIRGTSTPFGVPVAVVLLKLPTGALTAFLGLVLIHGGFVPGLSALDSSGQIIAWALLFGAAQQLVTGFVDRKAQSVLESVGPTPITSETE